MPSLPSVVVEAEEEGKAAGRVADRMGPAVGCLLWYSPENSGKVFNCSTRRFPPLWNNDHKTCVKGGREWPVRSINILYLQAYHFDRGWGGDYSRAVADQAPGWIVLTVG